MTVPLPTAAEMLRTVLLNESDTSSDMTEADKILPIAGKRNVLITSALPYVNNVPHLGNVIGSVLSADVFARYAKARGYQCLFICGSDEYGTATETKALEEGVTPQQLCDKYHALHKGVYDWFEIAFDKWGRTPTQEQTDIAQDIFLKLHKNGYLEERTTTQPFCDHPDHQSFLADRFVEGTCPLCGYADARGDQCDSCGHLLDPLDLINPKCKRDGTAPIKKETKHVFLLLDKLQSQIEEWSQKASKEGAWSSNGISITEKWLNEGLHGRGITRDLKWGTAVPLPGYEDKVLYVWFDACIGYVSITATYTKEWEKWWRNPDVQLYQFMGKDNVPFHTVVFPGSQLGTGDKWTMLHHLSTTEYLNYEKGKFSKSRNIGVFGTNAKDTGIHPDVWRYYLLTHRPETGDSEFVWEDFVAANNNELLNNLGNGVNRVVKFLNSKVYDSIVPDYTKFTDSTLEQHRKDANLELKEYLSSLEAVKLRAGLASAIRFSALLNLLLQSHKLDNKLAESEPDKCAAVIGLAVNHVHILASLIAPYMPATTDSILKQLNKPLLEIPDEWQATSIEPGHKIGKAAYLFSRIKPEQAQVWREMFGGDEAKKAKEEAAAKKAANKAAKLAKKGKKKADANGEVAGPDGAGKAVETIEKGGDPVTTEKTAVEEVTQGVKQAALQSS